MHKQYTFWAGAGTLLLALSACGETGPQQEPEVSEQIPRQQPYEHFFNAMQTLCGQAFTGERVVERPPNDLLEGDEELIVHFRECTDQTIKAPFHIEQPAEDSWDRSRTWIYTLHEEGLELRHDHRLPDGSPDTDNTDYGGYTSSPGSAERQLFIYTERTGDEGEVLGWRIELVPGERYSYGTMADGDWTWRIDFDLTEPVEAPPAPWGYED